MPVLGQTTARTRRHGRRRSRTRAEATRRRHRAAPAFGPSGHSRHARLARSSRARRAAVGSTARARPRRDRRPRSPEPRAASLGRRPRRCRSRRPAAGRSRRSPCARAASTSAREPARELPAFAQGPVSRPALTSSCGGRCWSSRAAGRAHASGSSSRCRSLLRLPRNNKRRARAGVITRGRCQHRSADAAHPITRWAQKTPFPASFNGRYWAQSSDPHLRPLASTLEPWRHSPRPAAPAEPLRHRRELTTTLKAARRDRSHDSASPRWAIAVTSLRLDDLDVEVAGTEHAHEREPERQVHLGAPGRPDAARGRGSTPPASRTRATDP